MKAVLLLMLRYAGTRYLTNPLLAVALGVSCPTLREGGVRWLEARHSV